MFEFYDRRWIKNFRMYKNVIVKLAQWIALHVQKHETKYHKVVLVIVRICCTLYKLTQGASLLHCSESFAIKVTTVNEMLQDVVRAINLEFRNQIQWPMCNHMLDSMSAFQCYCTLPRVVGAINGMHFKIWKPTISLEDYYYFES